MNQDGKMVQIKGSVLYPQDIQMETELKNYVTQEPPTPLDNAIFAAVRVEKLKEAADLMEKIEATRNADIDVEYKDALLSEEKRELGCVLAELGMEYDEVEEKMNVDISAGTKKEIEEIKEGVDEGGEREPETPEERAKRALHLDDWIKAGYWTCNI